MTSSRRHGRYLGLVPVTDSQGPSAPYKPDTRLSSRVTVHATQRQVTTTRASKRHTKPAAPVGATGHRTDWRTAFSWPAPDQPTITIQVRSADEPMVITTAAGKVHARPGTAEHPDATLAGPSRLVIAALSGWLDLDYALRQGLLIEGDPPAVAQIRS
jgi:hypothetical protein